MWTWTCYPRTNWQAELIVQNRKLSKYLDKQNKMPIIKKNNKKAWETSNLHVGIDTEFGWKSNMVNWVSSLSYINDFNQTNALSLWPCIVKYHICPSWLLWIFTCTLDDMRRITNSAVAVTKYWIHNIFKLTVQSLTQRRRTDLNA